MSEEVFFKARREGLREKKKDISKTLFCRNAEYRTLRLWEAIHEGIIAGITVVPKASDAMKKRFHKGLHGHKESFIYNGNWETKSRYSGIYL